MKKAGQSKVWGKLYSAADIQSYRRIYAKSLYQTMARDTAPLSWKELYIGRKGHKGMRFDRDALQLVALNLGHSKETTDRKKQRVGIVVNHYL
ncbi:hypothetical protein HCH52_08530 [Oscillospiraceae bacterium HV4-5-C5C]|nr:hypothetical protein [Oscillospiraceae bacterium HV4-5-C5C]